MSTRIVKNMAELKAANLKHARDSKSASKRIIRRFGFVNVSKSQAVIKTGLIPYPGGGALFSSIELKGINAQKVRVLAVDYGKGGEASAEIEHGLKRREFRQYTDNPKLKDWARDKMDFVPPKGVLVGKSPGGVPHPLGLHYMELGALEAIKQKDMIINQEINKIRV